jgi:UDP-N-acetylmuramoyl-L-alanyl-D-glutamate--2,6-diaminopimelate ligase
LTRADYSIRQAPPWGRELEIVGVTGTNGKTTTTRLVAAVLSEFGCPVPSITTVGFFLGRDLVTREQSYDAFLRTLELGQRGGSRYAVLEFSSEALAQGMSRVWPCKVGVFTNLTRDHLDAHPSPEHYFASKAQLFCSLLPGGTAVLNGHDEVSPLMAEVVPPHARTLTFGLPSRGPAYLPVEISGVSVHPSWEGTSLEAKVGEETVPLFTQGIGEIFAENALAALAVAVARELPTERAAAAIAATPPPPGRFQVMSRDPGVVIDYAHTPDAVARTLSTARGLCRGRLTVVMGAGGNRDRDKRRLMGAELGRADRAIITSDNPRDESPQAIAEEIAVGIPSSVAIAVILDRRQAIETAVREAAPEDVVLIAGKGHETTQEVAGTKLPFSDQAVVGGLLGDLRR